MAPAIAMGNTCVLVPSETAPLAATDFYQVLETSDLPAGVVNIVTGAHADLAKTLGRPYGCRCGLVLLLHPRLGPDRERGGVAT